RRISVAYYQELQRLQQDALTRYQAAKQREVERDRQIRDIKERQISAAQDAEIAQSGPGTQLIALEKRADEKIADLKKAVAAGDVEGATRLQQQLDALSSRIAGLDTIFAGDAAQRIANEAGDAFTVLLEKQKAAASQQAELANQQAAALGVQLKQLQDEITA